LVKKPIYVALGFHLDDPIIREFHQGPSPTSITIKKMLEMFERYNIKGEFSFTGSIVQELSEDYPEAIDIIKKLKIPITYHGGAGHSEPGPAGQMRDTRNLPIEEAIRAEWEFETHWLQPNWRIENGKIVIGNPDAGKPLDRFGGFLRIEREFNVIPMPLAISGIYPKSMDWHHKRFTPTLKALGAGSYEPSHGPECNANILLGLHEIYLFPGFGVPPKYFREKPGVDSPMLASPEEWLSRLSEALPRDKEYYTYTMVHGRTPSQLLERFIVLVEHLLDNPEFRIVWPDPNAEQWKQENRALEFFKKTYGVNSFEEVLKMPYPIERIREMWRDERVSLEEVHRRSMRFSVSRGESSERLTPKKKTITKGIIAQMADYLVINWPQEFSHDGDFPGPPSHIDLGGTCYSLSEAFEAFVYALEHYVEKGYLPEKVEIEDVLGPIDYPMYELEEEPKIDSRKLTGYIPREISEDKMPDPELVNSQGLPACGDYHVWMPIHTIVDDEDVMQAVWNVAKTVRKEGHIPGMIEIPLRSEESRGKLLLKYKAKVNAAEFLYALAQEYKLTYRGGPGPVMMISMKMAQAQTCALIAPYSPVGYKGAGVGQWWRLGGFIWRAKMSIWALNRAWTYKPNR